MKLTQLSKKLPNLQLQCTREKEMKSSTEAWKQQPSEKIWASQPLTNDLYKFIQPESRILDLGCGRGEITSEIYDAGSNYWTKL